MKESGLLILFFFLFFRVRAQERSVPNAFLHPLHPSITAVIGILSIMFSIAFLLLAYAKFCQNNNHVDASNDDDQVVVRSWPRFSGIDRTAIESLPFFKFSSLKGSKEGLECAVCLSKFDDEDVLRLLPSCKHAFHMNCIDQWLESHSSCPLCRNRLDSRDLKNFAYSNSLRFLENPSNLSEDPNVELFVRREQDYPGSHSSRFNIGSSFRKIEENKEILIQDDDRKLLHKFKHKIVVSDVVIKNRWSDVNPSDLLSLSSEMLSVMSSNRFSSLRSSSGRFHGEQIEKIKEDIERKRTFQSKFSRMARNNSASSSAFSSASNNEPNTSKGIIPAEKRSVSEITAFSRFSQFSSRNRTPPTSNSENEERIRTLWFPMVRRTVQWFTGEERKLEKSENHEDCLDV
ncbi:hypothetical protein SLA2020_218480 [Shorea laevis]